MPHSSGGGSHSGGSSSSSSRSSGGGSHSSGYHSSSSYSSGSSSYSSRSYGSSSYSSSSYRSSGSSHSSSYTSTPLGGRAVSYTSPASRIPSVSKNDFPGAQRYVYYRSNKPHYIYSDYQKYRKPERHLGRLLIYVPIICFLLSAFLELLLPPEKLHDDYDHRIVIQDSTGILGETGQLEAALNEFYDTTGISPAVITVTNEEWNTYYTDLFNYAYDLYVNRFEDERHWLIVYSQPAQPDPTFVDWFWEGVQGDETDPILTKTVTEDFGLQLQHYLTASSRYTVCQAITKAFSDCIPELMKPMPLTWEHTILDPLLILGVILLALFRSGLLKRDRPLPTGLPEDAVICSARAAEVTCEYCSGVYLADALKCPHCGAARTAAATAAAVSEAIRKTDAQVTSKKRMSKRR